MSATRPLYSLAADCARLASGLTDTEHDPADVSLVARFPGPGRVEWVASLDEWHATRAITAGARSATSSTPDDALRTLRDRLQALYVTACREACARMSEAAVREMAGGIAEGDEESEAFAEAGPLDEVRGWLVDGAADSDSLALLRAEARS